MKPKHAGLTRGRLLKLSAAAAIGTAVAAVFRDEDQVAEAQSGYGEAPSLAAQVRAGLLPPVEERLPENPLVIQHKWLGIGKYGGTLHMSHVGEWSTGHHILNGQYGHSPIRWLRDGLEIGPGLAERWESNEDASVWTFYFRQGLKWSDGNPWSVNDIMFWWEDEIGHPDLKEFPPDETKSGIGTVARLQKLDDTTLQLQFDAPAPLTADRIAMWTKRGIGGSNRWMDPKHYLTQFHIRYNASLDPATWVTDFLQKRDPAVTAGCPTVTGWYMEQFELGVRSVWARNPYYWCVDKSGNQLPYIDRVVNTIMQDAEVLKLRYTGGQADFVMGNWSNIPLSDITIYRQAEPRSGLEVRLWDGGSGTSSMYFFNHNFRDPKYRGLFRNPTFLKALSHAYNRPQVQRAVYFNTGELTTGTMSPKAIEYQIPGGKSVYESWRDAAVKYDPELAKRLLDEIGVVDVNRDGWREFPDGSALRITLDYQADQSPTGEHIRKDEILRDNWRAIGINAELNPIEPPAWQQLWEDGLRMMHTTWEVGDGPNHLVYPQWVVPLEPARWAPLFGNYATVRGTPTEFTELETDPYQRTPRREAPEPGSPVARLWDLYDQARVAVDALARHHLVWEMIKIHVQDGPFYSGTVANTPRPILVKKGLLNVPRREDLGLGGFVNPWIHPTPAVYDPESFYWDNPAAHSA